MKYCTFIGLFLSFTSLAIGLSNRDKQVIIQLRIDLDELQQYYHAD